jgi:glycosyltransferase involved in cell wall biosynthesis
MEGQPISILEAMATGSLIITTTQGGIPDIIKNGEQGLFVEKQNVEDLVLKMKSIASNPKIISDIGVKNQAHFSKNFTMKAFTSRLMTIFRK